MVNIQAVINESSVLTDDKVQPPTFPTQVHRNFTPDWSEYSEQILCCYINTTSKIQIARIANISNCYFERVVFPGQRLLFEALPDAQLEIHTGMMVTAILSDQIPCDRLRVSLQ